MTTRIRRIKDQTFSYNLRYCVETLLQGSSFELDFNEENRQAANLPFSKIRPSIIDFGVF